MVLLLDISMENVNTEHIIVRSYFSYKSYISLCIKCL